MAGDVQVLSFVHLMNSCSKSNICASKPPHRQYPNRWQQAEKIFPFWEFFTIFASKDYLESNCEVNTARILGEKSRNGATIIGMVPRSIESGLGNPERNQGAVCICKHSEK
jgi:hypothetical protein